jgi:hypothetical protein
MPTEAKRVFRETDELGKDLMALRQSLRVLEIRVLESKEQKRIHPLEEWVGTMSSVGALRMAVTAMEHIYQDYREHSCKLALGGGDKPNEC